MRMPACAAAMALATAPRSPAPAPAPTPARWPFRPLSTRERAPVVASATRVGRLIESEGTVLVPGCYDALSATIVQKSGFHASFISGYGVAASLLGKPDFGLLTYCMPAPTLAASQNKTFSWVFLDLCERVLTSSWLYCRPPEMAETARHVCAAAPLTAFIVDADTGGGSALNVQRTVQDLIAAGAAGCFLEDQAWPKKCGHMRGKQVIPAEEHAVKIAAARDAIGGRDFFLVARTDARSAVGTGGIADAIARANLYMDAGADACFVESPRSVEELREICRRTRGYRVCNLIEGGATPLQSLKELKEMGFHLMVQPLTTLYATTRALIDMLSDLKELGTTRDRLHKLATFDEFNNLIDLESWFELEARFSKMPEKEPVAAGNGSM